MSLNPADWHYNITQVSEITGLSKQVIRKWEERYQIVQPMRLDNGHRVYSDQDLQLFLKVRGLSQQGYSIKQAVEIVKEEKNHRDIVIPSSPTVLNEEMNDFYFLLLENGTHCNEFELNRILQQAHQTLGLSEFLTNVVIPFLKEVGNRWEKKEWSEYQECLSSMAVRDYLVQIRRNFRWKENAPLMMGACLPGEYHEIPLHILLLQGMMAGWKSFLVGSSPAIGTIESLVRELRPKVVLLSATTTKSFEQYQSLIQQLDTFAANNQSIKFFIGGEGIKEYLKDHKLHFISFASSMKEVIDQI